MKTLFISAVLLISFIPGLFIYWHANTAIPQPPKIVENDVRVQLIQVCNDNGTESATVLGTPTQRKNIEHQVQGIWKQGGIHIIFEPQIKEYNNSFALRGHPPGILASFLGVFNNRPKSDVALIANNAQAAGITNKNPHVLNIFFVDVAPGNPTLKSNQIAGMSLEGKNGITVFVGNKVLQFQEGQNRIARMLAHEIGINLGLKEDDYSQNLMDARLTGQNIRPKQGSIARSSPYVSKVQVPNQLQTLKK